MTKVNDFSFKLAGAAGQGILNAGLSLFGKTCQRGGLNVFATAEYPSLIRGGHNHLDVRVADRQLYSHTKHVSLLLALNKESIKKHSSKIIPGGGIIYDADEIKDPEVSRDDISLFPIPMKKLATEAGGVIMSNTVGVGATFALLGCDLELLNGVIKENFSRKSEEIVEGNCKAAQLGYDHVKKSPRDFPFKLEFKKAGNLITLSGHQALATGAIKAGCKFYSAYPMTPATSILHTMAKYERDYNIVVKHTEDEIAAINMAIGASFAGLRAMTGTSGGGFSLMVEGFGLAAQTETPLVVVESMRPGPASGMATHTGQGDLKFIVNTSPDEFPRIVIAPGDAADCFNYTIQAFNLADKYQLPVMIMTDKYMGESYMTVPEFSQEGIKVDRGLLITDAQDVGGNYLRYKNTPSGVSPRTIPGVKGGEFTASSYEHDEEGNECEGEENRVMMHKKRFRKLDALVKDVPGPQLVGPEEADVTFISWGSTKGAIMEAIMLLEKEGISANFLQIVFLSPFPTEKVKEILETAKEAVIVEGNITSQLNSLIREHCLTEVKHKILRYDGRPFNPEDIYNEIREILKPSREGYSAKTGDY